MIRLLLLCVLASSQATAQNWPIQALLELNEDQWNEAFTYLLRDSNARCDRVIFASARRRSWASLMDDEIVERHGRKSPPGPAPQSHR
jgi:hypothetical protein